MSKQHRFFPLVTLLLLLLATFAVAAAPAGAPTADPSKPDGGLIIDLRPAERSAASAGPFELVLEIVAADPAATVETTLQAHGSLQTRALGVPQTHAVGGHRQPQVERFDAVLNGDGTALLRVEARAFDAAGNLLAVRSDQLYLLAADGRVYFSTSGPLDLQLQQLNDRRSRGLSEAAYSSERDRLLGGGAAETIGVETLSSRANITVQGKIQYTDSAGNTHPVRLASVEIRDAEAAGSVLVTTVQTNANGDYTATVDNNDGPGEGGRDIFVRALAKGPGFTILPPTAGATVHRIDSSVSNNVADGATVTVNLTANKTADNNTAFAVHDALVTVNQYVPTVNGSRFPDINVIFPTTRATSLFDGTNLHILQLDRFDWDVIHHEYGHYAMKRLNIENNPGGAHSFGSNNGETRGKDAGIRLAWGEGWPTYFAVSLQQVQGVAAMNIPNAGDTVYQDTEDSTLNIPLEPRNGPADVGEDDELSVLRALWDLYDAANDDNDRGVALGHAAIWSTLDGANAKTLSDAYKAFVQGKPVAQEVRIGCIFMDHRVAPEPTAPADKLKIAATPPAFTWNANGGGPSNRNDKFFVEFYNADYSKLLHKSAELGATTYTPSQADWDTIRKDGGVLVNWVVRGRQTNAPATGPYLSCQRRLVQSNLDLVFAIDATGSMFDDIAFVAQSATEIVDAIADSGADFRIAVVTYKDHPVDPYGDPGDYPARVDLGFSTDAAAIKAAINAIVVDGGNDWPEAVYSGAMTSLGLPWRANVQKSIILMGDAPPHDPEPFTGYTMASVIQAANNLTVTVSGPRDEPRTTVEQASIFPVLVGFDSEAEEYFQGLADGTNGELVTAANAEDVVDAILEAVGSILATPFADAGGPYSAEINAPQTLDASNSFDIDGTIVSYEWDIDNDGTYDISGDQPVMQYTYAARYDGLVRLRVRDNDGRVATATANILAAQSPTADAGGPYQARFQQPVLFDAGGSTDADGSIVKYEWDFNNDGLFDHAGSSPTVSHTYPGSYSGVARLRISDNDGRTALGAAAVRIEMAKTYIPILAQP